jgi:hypothetical protein
VAWNKFSDFVEETGYYITEEEARNDYDTYLFHYGEFQRSSTDKMNIIKEILNYDPKLIQGIPVLKPKSGEDANDVVKRALKYDLAILRGVLPSFKINDYIFTEDYLCERYPETNIEIIEQNPKFFGFTQNTHERKFWKIKNYCNYLHIKKSNERVSEDLMKQLGAKKDQVYFGVNIDMDNMYTPCRELKTKLSPNITFGTFNDALSYVREPIRGMTLPQYYLKEEYVWTGGHEENLRIRSININHGNGPSEWYGVSLEDNPTFQQHVYKNEKNINIYTKEGLWYVNYEYFLKHKLKCIYGIQQPGDIMVVGPGCIHWVRSRGFSLHTSWNFCTKDAAQLRCCYDRYKINIRNQIRNLVPLMTLFVDLANFELNNLDLDALQFINETLRVELEIAQGDFTQLREDTTKQFTLLKEYNHLESLVCDYCYRETFFYWGLCKNCDEAKKEGYHLSMCIPCFNIHYGKCKTTSYIIYYKYENSDIEKLFNRIERRLKNEDIVHEDTYQYELTRPNDEVKKLLKYKIDAMTQNYSTLTKQEKIVYNNYLQFEADFNHTKKNSNEEAKEFYDSLMEYPELKNFLQTFDIDKAQAQIENDTLLWDIQKETPAIVTPVPNKLKGCRSYFQTVKLLKGIPDQDV